ncbi:MULTISPECIES: hypothetical protein [Streptomyces]|uniref:Uncharacterized protein n=1 Tax=Streptomyces spororaveus TaxID=284039 RepID=A0ABQ3TDI1_9ACTN|nr:MULTISPECIES: hypothetical protein [Streptomyces]MCM9081132.1 hypothetical protein [Streptomyces spororaveus]MCX5304421.1 hypothetical protein [Streptomyces sp. NBC_00160]GHI78474.1 hypothetical protein Sspor_40350 [Streptomyces spororaveus]
MTYPRESIDLPEDRGCLRWVLGVPLGIIHLLNALAVSGALFAGPRGEWDDQGYENVGALCLVSVSLSVLGLLITVVPSVRRAMGPWWLAPPLLLGLTAFLRGATLG